MKRRVSVTRRWSLADEDTLGASGIDDAERRRRSDAMQAWRRLVLDGVGQGMVAAWDDGRDQWPWYNACRCKAERRLFLACEAALGHKAETTLDAGGGRGDEPCGGTGRRRPRGHKEREMSTKCATCDEPKVGCLFCGRCSKAFDRWNRESDGDMAEVIVWAGERAKRVERRRVAAKAKGR